MEFERITLEQDGPVAIIALNHPEALNAVSPPMLAGFNAALDHVEAPASGVRCLILTGTGRGFCAGANLSASAGDGVNDTSNAGATLETRYHPLLRRLRNLPMPFLTAVNGPAAGVGMSFALMGDMVLAARGAYFLQAFRRIGLIPDGGSTWLLPRLIGLARARELSLMGEKLPAEKALDWGLINRVHDDDALMDEARALARELAHGPTQALGLIRTAYWKSPGNSYEEQLDLEQSFQRQAGQTADFREGVTAFLEKRKAIFTGS